METNQTTGAQRPNPTDRPTLADFGAMLADAAEHYGTIRHDAGTLNDEETANDVLEHLGDFAEELALTDTSANSLCALMEVINEYAVNATTPTQQEKATNAAAASRQILTLWGLIKDYRAELWQISNAVANYTAAIRNANKAAQSRENVSVIQPPPTEAMETPQNAQKRATEGNNDRPTLAALYAATVFDYFCGAEAPEQMREGAEMMGATLHELGRLATGTLAALMRVTAHYAATVTDADKSAILATLTAPNGAGATLARLTSDADRLNVWGDILETLAEN